MARSERRAWAFIVLCGVGAASIVVETTSPPPTSALDVAVQAAGLGFDVIVRTLDRFAASTTLPWYVVELFYGAVGVFVWIVATFVFERYGYPRSESMAFPVLLAVTFVGALVAVLLTHTAQFIALGLLGVVVAGLAAVVP